MSEHEEIFSFVLITKRLIKKTALIVKIQMIMLAARHVSINSMTAGQQSNRIITFHYNDKHCYEIDQMEYKNISLLQITIRIGICMGVSICRINC